MSSTLSIDPRLDLTNEQPRVFEFQALQKVKVKGRLVDSKGEGIAKALVLCSVAADETTPWQSKSKEKDPYDFARQWPRAGNCESDSEGNYEVDLAYGKAILQVIREGYLADPSTMEFEVTADEDFIVPHVVLYPVPKLRGKIIYEDASPAVGAYVRMRHSGIGDADPICESNEDGLFTLIPSRIPNTDGSGIEANVFVVVMDTKTGKGGVAKVNLKDAEDCDNILVRLEPRSTSWMFDIVKAYRSDVELEAIQKDRDSASKEFTLGTEGMQVPSMREGTWLNTDAKGLEDFQGNFVLLDFWFIGCGPCHRDIPSIRMVHRHLSKYGFSVVSVHKDGEAPEDVKIFADKNDMRYPIVVDDAEGTITKQFRELGLIGFPHYILLDRQGRIIHNDAVSGGPSLRSYKFEKVFQAIRNATPN